MSLSVSLSRSALVCSVSDQYRVTVLLANQLTAVEAKPKLSGEDANSILCVSKTLFIWAQNAKNGSVRPAEGEPRERGCLTKMSSCEKEDSDSDPLGPIHQKRSQSPVPSCVSMKSDWSMDLPVKFGDGEVPSDQRPIHQKRSQSPVPSCVSMKSDQSMDLPVKFGDGEVPSDQSPKKRRFSTPAVSYDWSKDLPSNLKGGDSSAGMMEGASSTRRPPSPTPTRVSMKSDESVDQIINFTGGDSSTGQYLQIHKSHLKKKFQCVSEGIPQQGDTRLLHEIYTELYITGGGRGEVNDEHEVRQIERASWREAAQGKSIKCSEMFKPLRRQGKPIRTVLTKGVAGIGKTVSVQKFILDWAEGRANQDVHFIFPLPFRELNLMKEKKLSLVDLIQHFFPEIKDPRVFTSSEHRIMFIFDGLDECRLPLDFHSNTKRCNVTEPASVDVLLTNLIKGNLLPSALLWITTRPAAANQIPHKCVSQVTEIRGFNDPQKEEYFRKRISDKNLVSRVITHLKSSRSLYIMCHIPVFCWISATVVENTSKGSESVEMPRTLTQMYTHFLIIQTSIKKGKYTERKERDEEVIFKLGKLAFQQLEKGNLIFYEEDLRECGIDVTEASVYSGVCTQIFREESGLSKGKVFSFVHLSIQEFLAALYVFLCFSNRQRNMPDQQQTSQLSALFRAATLHDLHKTAVDLALQSKNGHLDLFLRFLLGLSLESNQTLLRHLLPQSSSQSQSSEQIIQYVKQKIRDGRSDMNQSTIHSPFSKDSDRRINLFYCLNELNHHAVVEIIKRSSGTLYVDMLLPGEWKTKRFEFKMSGEQLAEFDLQKYIKTPEKDQTELLSPDEVLQKLVPVVTTSTSAQLESCNLTEKSCSYLASALTSHSSSLRVLKLTGNELLDSGVELLCSGLQHQNCKLEELQLRWCDLTGKSCSYLASALTSSSLRLLNLRGNELIRSSDAEQLCALVKEPHCKLETLVCGDGIFRKESPSAVAAPTSISQSSDTAGLLSVDNPLEDLRTDDQHKSCSSCAEVPDSSWVPVKPEVSSEKRVSTYSLSSPAGSYECTVSRLRWSCAGPVSLQYRFTDWNVYAEQLAHMQIRPAGPLMDIKLISGELEEIHLPHFLYLGDSEASVCDAVKVLHGQDSGVCVEECELTRHHARLLHPSFSLLGPVYYVINLFYPKVCCELLLFCTRTTPLTLHVYVVPNDPSHIEKIREKEKHKGVWVDKPGAVGPLPPEVKVCLTTSCLSVIQPQEINLQRVSTSNYFEIYTKHPGEAFHMEVFSSEDTEPIWSVQIRREDYQQPSRMSRQVGSQEAAAFVDEHRSQIISRVTEVMPIADRLLSQRVISQESYSTISAAPTSQARMRALYERLHSAGAQGKLAFYTILQEQERLLVEDLWTT